MRLREILPITEWLGSYSLMRLGPDGVAGLSLAAFVIPESLAYASLAGLPPVSGLYCYLAAGLAYAVFGTSRQLAVGPTSALALAVAAAGKPCLVEKPMAMNHGECVRMTEAFAARRMLGHVGRRTAILAAECEALQQPQRDQDDRRRDADGGGVGQQADDEGRQAHDHDGDEEGVFAADEIADTPEDEGADAILHEAQALSNAGAQAIVVRSTGPEPTRWLEETWGPVVARLGDIG